MIQLPEGISRKDLETIIDLFNSWGKKHQTEGMIEVLSYYLTISGWKQRAEAAEAKLAELDKQEPVAFWNRSGQVVTREECHNDKIFAICCKVERPLFTRPAPAINIADLLPDEMTSEMAEQLFYGKAITAVDVWNACLAAMLRNIEEKSK